MITEARRKAFAEFEGIHPKSIITLPGYDGLRYIDGNIHKPLPSYANETDLFRLIRKMDTKQRTFFRDELFYSTDNGRMSTEEVEDAMWQATTDQLQEAIAKALEVE